MSMKEINLHIQGLKEASDNSFLYFYDLFEKPLYNHLLKMLGTESLCEEILQETMLTMINKIHQYSDRVDLENSFKSWVFRIATNLAIDEIRKTKKVSFVQAQEQGELSTIVEEQDTKSRIHELINTLPIIQRTFLNLKVQEQMSLLEIAVICKCEVNSVKQGLFRARKSLKNKLINEGIGL